MFYIKMKQSLFLKMLTLFILFYQSNVFSDTLKDSLNCKTIFKTKNLQNVILKALEVKDSKVWIAKDNKNFKLITISDNGKVCNINYENILAEKDFITLTDLGYTDDIYVEGTNPYFQVYFPLYKTFIGGKAVFNIEISPMAKEDSVIAVKVNNKIEKVIKLKDFGYTGFIELPLKNYKNIKFIKISIDADIKVGRNICDDINAKNIFIKINPYKSGFYVLKDTKMRDIKTFFLDYNKKFYIADINLNSLKLFYYIPNVSNWLKADVEELKDIKIPSKIIYIDESGNYGKLEETSKGLLLTLGNPDIVSNFVIKSAMFNEINSSDVVENRYRLDKNSLTLRELGISNLTLTGVGILSFNIPFNTAKIGGLPDKLQFNMFVSHSAIDKHDRAFLEVFVNNSLVKAYQLKEEATEMKGLVIDIPKSLLGAGLNLINIKVGYYPSSDRCIGTVPKITVSLDKNSYFVWNETINRVSKVRDFFNIVNGKVAVVVSGKPLFKATSKILEILGKVNPNISKLDIYTKISDFDPKDYDYIMLFLDPKTAKKILNEGNVPLKIDEKGFSIFNIKTGKKLFTLNSNESISFMEIIEYKDRPTFVLSYINSPETLEGVNIFNPVNINSLLGNLVLFSPDDYSVYNIGDYINIEYISDRGLLYYWNNYKVIIISILAVIVILFEIFVLRNLVKTKRK